MVMNTGGGLRRRLYTTPKALETVTAKNRAPSPFDQPRPPSFQSQPPAGITAGQQPRPQVQDTRPRSDSRVTNVNPTPGREISAAQPSAPPRAGVWRGGEGPSTRAGWLRSEGFDPIGQTGWMGWGGELDPRAASTEGLPGWSTPGEGATGQTTDALGRPIGGVAEGLRQARSLADQVAFEQSEAGRSYQHSPLSLDDEAQPLAEDDPLRDPVYSEPSGQELTDQEKANWEAEQRYLAEARRRATAEGGVEPGGDPNDPVPGGSDAHEAFNERAKMTAEMVGRTGWLTYQEALWLLENAMYMDTQGRIRRTSGTDLDDDLVIFDADINNKGRGGDHEWLVQKINESQYAKDNGLSFTALTAAQQTGKYDPENGDVAGVDPEAAPEEGEYGYPAGSWEDEQLRAIFETPLPEYSEEDIAGQRRGIREANIGVYQEALKTAGYQNLMMGGSPEMMMGVQADTMRRVGTASAQQELMREFEMRDRNYQMQIADAMQKRQTLSAIAQAHRQDELGLLAFNREKELARMMDRMKREFTEWFEENIAPSQLMQILGATGSAAGQAGASYAAGAAYKAGAGAPAATGSIAGSGVSTALPAGATAAGAVGGAGTVLAAGGSDTRLKENIQDTKEDTYKHLGLSEYTWTWNDEAGRLYGLRGEAKGVLAQELEGVLPAAVSVDEHGYRMVRYDMLTQH